ncbi:MAG: hypothetical protein IT280_07520, partial [Ignavibacteria bacterium]|nr:hypothetical protein [Ignavibacteria bacterium]
MKNIIKFILLLVICNTIYSQININDIRNRIALKGPVQLPDSVQINLLIEQLLQIYGNTLDSYSDLKAGNYNIKINNGYSIEIANANKGKIVIHINKTESRLGGYSLTLDEKSVKMLVSQNNVIPFNKVTSIDNIIVRNNILIDKEILPYEELQPDERRILDKEFTTDNFVDQYNNDLELYKMCQAGLMFPYSGGHSKFVTVDDQYSSLIYFDEGLSADDNTPLNRCYGYFGDDDGEFMNPAGICVGRMTTVSNKDIYPLYIADKTGLRITSVNFVADNNFAALGKIDTTTFKRTAIITYPYDIAYFTNYLDSTDDKLWITQQHPTQNFLTCINLEGSVMQSFSGYKSYDNGQTYAFESNTLSRLAVYNDGFACLLFIDNTRNCLVSCLLGSDGLAGVEIIDSRNDYIIAHEIVPFPSSYAINSVQFQKTTLGSNVWPSLWVTSPSYIHHLKINKSGNIQYLASSNLPNNSLESFTYLRNTICYNGVYDIFTIENWSMSRGIRKYYPFCDIHSESLENYCNDCLDIMKFKATFTNDCWLYLTAKRKNRDGNWESVKIKKLNGSTIDTTFVIKWQFAGWNQSSADLFIDLQLDLPIEDYAFGDSVALSIRMYPEYSNPTSYFSSDHIENTYKGYVSKSCLPRPGGCPFIYIHNGQNDFEADNNILQRMEYSAPGVDILDVYKLRTNPKITSNSFDIYLVENEQDSAFIDKVRMFAVDFPSNKKLGVTEDNKIVIYDSVQVLASDSVMLNNSNITNDVHYHHPSSTLTTGLSTDSIYAHFSNPTDKKKRFNVSYSDTKLKETRAISIQSSKLGPNINYPVA